MGKALAIQLAQRGANVTIVARNERDLKEAQREIEAHRASPQKQRILAISADVMNAVDAKKAVERAAVDQGHIPECVFLVAGRLRCRVVCIMDDLFLRTGSSKPGLFLEQSLTDFQFMMQLNYLGAVHVAQPAVQLMQKEGTGGRLVFVSSVLGLFSFTGYSQYSASKYALRGGSED
jgi:3-dehydrosphinganine reductase